MPLCIYVNIVYDPPQFVKGLSPPGPAGGGGEEVLPGAAKKGKSFSNLSLTCAENLLSCL